MHARRRFLVLLCAVCALAASAIATSPALAAGNAIVNECQSRGKLTQQFTLGELQHAFAVLPATAKEYTDCVDVIQQAIVAAKHGGTGGGTGGGGGGGSFLPTPVIVILVVLILAAITFGALAGRRRRAGADSRTDDERP